MKDKTCTDFFLRLLKPVVLKKQSTVSHPAPVHAQSHTPGLNSNGVGHPRELLTSIVPFFPSEMQLELLNQQ